MERFEDLLNEIHALKTLFDNINCDHKKLILSKIFENNLEKFVHKMEETYYKKIILKKPIHALKSNLEQDIQRNIETMNLFIPFAMHFL